MGVLDDLLTIESYVKALFPLAKTGKQLVPDKPVANSFYIRIVSEDRETETRYHYRVDRTYEVIHFAARPDTALSNMDKLGRAIYQTELIGHIRVGDFAISEPSETENELYVTIGVIETSVRESRDQVVWPKINNITVRKV